MDALSHHDIALLLLAVGVLIGVARVFGEVVSRFGQPAVIGEILAGVALGPTVFGRMAPAWAATLFPASGPGAVALHGLTTLSITMFLLVAGLEIDLSTVWRRGRRALVVAGGGMAVPFTLGFAVAWWLPGLLGPRPDAGCLVFALFMAIAVSISALPVIAKTLMDLNLFRTDVGITIIAAAVVNDIAGWLVFAVVLAMLGAAAAGPSFGIGATIALTVGFAVVMLSVGRKLVDRLLQWVQVHASWPGGVLGLALTLGLLALTPNAEANLEIARIARDTHGVPEALVVAPGLAASPEDTFLRALEIGPDLLRGEHDEVVARRIQRWEWVVVSEAAALAEALQTPGPAAVAFIPLVVERAGMVAAPAWLGMLLERGDTVHGLVLTDAAEVDDQAEEVRRVVARAPILSRRGELSAAALLAQAAEALSVRLNLGVDRLVALFHEHGCDQAGPLTPELAVPHLRLDGAGQFELVICHAPAGVRFGGDEQRPTAVFVLVSTVDHRDLHLAMLAAIASIALRDGFTATWASTTDSEALRGWLIAALAEQSGRR